MEITSETPQKSGFCLLNVPEKIQHAQSLKSYMKGEYENEIFTKICAGWFTGNQTMRALW